MMMIQASNQDLDIQENSEPHLDDMVVIATDIYQLVLI